MATDVTISAQDGYDAAPDAVCPYYRSSPNACGWLAGRHLRQVGSPRPERAAMSRGYWVRIDGVLLIDCENPDKVYAAWTIPR